MATAKSFVRAYMKYLVFMAFSLINVKLKAWEIDFSRRQTDFRSVEDVRMPAAVEETTASLISKVVNQVEPAQDIVILHTETGFVPETIRLKKNSNYNIHIVNVNVKEKNVSFMLDAFSQSLNTVFGEEKSFNVIPRVEGIFSFQSPETSKQGKIVIISDAPERKLASEPKIEVQEKH